MKQKMLLKEERKNGITLVALVCTIVVLLILAGITITMLFGENGIITKAQQAAEATKNGQDKDMQGLANLEEWITDATGEYAWRVSEDGTKVINKNYPDGIAIGSYINYDCTPVNGAKTSYTSKAEKTGYSADQTFTVADYKYSWRVLGADNKGQLLLISEEVVPCTTADGSDNTWGNNVGYVAPDRTSYFIKGKVGYENGIAELNAICDIYGHGKGAIGGKLITIEEINNITGRNGNNIDGNGTIYEKGGITEYGKDVTYYWDGTDYPYYEYTTSAGEKKTGKLTTSHASGFTWYNESTKKFETSPKPTDLTIKVTDVASMKKITTIRTTHYDYYVPGTSIETNNTALYKTLFINSSTGAYTDETDSPYGIVYYIGSSAVYIGTNYPAWGLGAVEDGYVCSEFNSFVNSNGDEYIDWFGVRPTISLKSNIKLTKRSDQRDGCDYYDIDV